MKQFSDPDLPLEEGDRVVGVRLRDAAARVTEERALFDFALWRDELRTIEDLSAFRTVDRNLIVGAGGGEPVQVAEMNAAAFRVARVRPLLGRWIDEADERPGAPAVVVLGYDTWQDRLAGDADAIGRTVRLGSTARTVVGVMPEGFAFPVLHEAWVPLPTSGVATEPRTGPRIGIVGRLAAGYTLHDAQRELAGIGLRTAADHPETHGHVRPEVLPFANAVLDVSDTPPMRELALFEGMLLALLSGNVALLIFARAATRESEIIVRNALGASRMRIVAQLFAEALVLGGLGAVIGLAATGFGLRWGLVVLEANLGRMPFWFDDGLSRVTVIYAAAMTLAGAAIAGIVPGLRVTRGVATRLRQSTAGGGGLRFGGVWTAVIACQVAVTVAFPVSVFFLQRLTARVEGADPGFATEQYLSARLDLDAGTSDTSLAELAMRHGRTLEQLERRLMADAAFEAVTFALQLPGSYHPTERFDMVGDDSAVPADSVLGVSVASTSVAADYFDVVGASILAGRGFRADDAETGRRVVIVNQSFVEHALHGRSPIGRRVRILRRNDPGGTAGEPAPEYEIIGVVKDLGMNHLGMMTGLPAAGIYHPLSLNEAQPVHLAARFRGDAAGAARRLQMIAGAVDPSIRLYEVQRLDAARREILALFAIFIRITSLVSGVALLLSFAGIYAVTSFTVSRRTREIGIRVALGSNAGRILLTIFRRPLAQISLGIVAGGLLTALLATKVQGDGISLREAGLITAYSALMMTVCMLACIVPTQRALRIQPVDALREDG